MRLAPHDPTGNKVEVDIRSTPTAKLGVTLGTTASSHVVVDKVFAGFPAAHLVVGDRVLAINGNPVNDVKGAMKLLAAAGTEVALTLRAPRHAAVIAVFKLHRRPPRLGIDLSFDPSTGACSVSTSTPASPPPRRASWWATSSSASTASASSTTTKRSTRCGRRRRARCASASW